MGKVKRFFQDVEKNISGILLLVILVILTYQVFTRYVLSNTPQWPEELARYLFIWLIFLGAAFAGQQNAHIRIETLIKVFPGKVRKWIMTLGETLWVISCMMMFYHSGLYALNLFAKKQISIGAHIPLAYIYAAIPIGFLLLAIRTAVNIFNKRLYTQLEEKAPGDDIKLSEDEGGEA
jgi:TRAP-type C4-dicarboxylate transport system permease small subunit